MIISGDRQQGKTTFLMKLVEILQESNIDVTGFFAIGVHDGAKRIGFDLVDVQSGVSWPLCREKEKASGYHKFQFNEDTLARGNKILEPEELADTKLIVIDEVGPVEMKNEGWARSIERICKQSEAIQVWTVRKAMVYQVASTWSVGTVYVADIGEDKPEDVLNLLKSLL